jgi:hypothetical protein
MHGIWLGVSVAIAAVLVVAALNLRSGDRFERIVRCRSGHLFTSTVVPGASVKAIRLGSVRFQRCPVGRHWTTVRRVDPATLTPEELASARVRHDVGLP